METCEVREFCNLFAQRAGEDPIGSASTFQTVLVVTAPTPWGSESLPAFLAGLLGPVVGRAREAGRVVRLQAICPEPEDQGLTRVMFYHKTPEHHLFSKTEFLVPQDELPQLAEHLVFQQDLSRWTPFQVHTQTRDWLICTHGSVDSACGKFGIPVYQHLKSLDLEGFRVFRTSHFGGHRFAPTVIDLPEGRLWAHLSPLEAEALVQQSLPVKHFRLKLRGWMGAEHFGQVLEREALLHHGWDWLTYQRTATLLSVEGGDAEGREDPKFAQHPPTAAQVEIRYQTPGGHTGTVRGKVVLSHHVDTLGGTGSTENLTRVNQYRAAEVEHL